MNAFNARSASALFRPACSAIWSTSSALFTLASECVRVPRKLNAFARKGQAFPCRASRALMSLDTSHMDRHVATNT
jgi:hypothetical protein